MDAENSLFAVLLKDEAQLQWGPIGQALAAHRHVPALDTVSEAKKCWGILAENLPEAAARTLADAMEKSKVGAILVPQNKLEVLAAALIIEDGQVFPLAHERIHVLAAAALSSSHSRTIRETQGPSGAQKLLSAGLLLTTGLPIRIGPKKKTIEKTVTDTNLAFVLDVVLKEPFERLRIIADDFDFSVLKERMLHGAMGNFRLLLSDLAAQAPSARKSRGARILLAGQPVTQMGYESLADLEKEIRWLRAI